MEDKTRGAWLIHHTRKLQATTNQDFDSIAFAGKCGTLLSAISAGKQSTIPQSRLDALARANHISPRAETPEILNALERQKLILRGEGGIEVLGVTGLVVLECTSKIFDELGHEAYEDAVIEVSEIASESPVTDRSASELMSDKYHLSSVQTTDTLRLGEEIGFFDSESISSTERLIFNGNLFRREEARKVNAVLSSLNAKERALLAEFNEKMQSSGCLPFAAATRVLGQDLFKRLHSIGMLDVSMVGNENGRTYFVTRPAAFSKFTNSIADDALDLSKALVTSLTYGMTISPYKRGRIQMVSALMTKLIAGGEVGPATAIGNDYQALEHRGVVRVTPSAYGMFSMTLLKPEVGRLALSVIEDGTTTAESIAPLPGAKVTEYLHPEATREVVRRKSSEAMKANARKLLDEIRTGGMTV